VQDPYRPASERFEIGPGQRRAAASHIEVTRYDPISYTARKVLEKRARETTIPYAREMADALGLPWRVSRARAWAQRVVWGRVRSGFYLQLRHEAISRALEAYPGSAVLELGAGFGTRGLSEAQVREAYVESDLPAVIGRKSTLIGAIRSGHPGPNHHFMAVNACSALEMEAAATFIAGLELSRPLLIVNEGTLMYLDDDEQRAFRDHVRAVLARCVPTGAWITTDFSERDHEETLLQRWMTRRLARTIERRFNRFSSDEAVMAFLAEGRLRGEKLASIAAPDDDAEVREVAESFRAWKITLEPAT
jgi:O-methyltransferase involved in polyketide biosynthesis